MLPFQMRFQRCASSFSNNALFHRWIKKRMNLTSCDRDRALQHGSSPTSSALIRCCTVCKFWSNYPEVRRERVVNIRRHFRSCSIDLCCCCCSLQPQFKRQAWFLETLANFQTKRHRQQAVWPVVEQKKAIVPNYAKVSLPRPKTRRCGYLNKRDLMALKRSRVVSPPHCSNDSAEPRANFWKLGTIILPTSISLSVFLSVLLLLSIQSLDMFRAGWASCER